MKSGDIIYCKRDMTWDGTMLFKENHPYKIKYVANRMVRIYCELGDGVDFNLHDYDLESENIYYYGRYFITQQEMRKLKLNEIKKG